MRTRTMIMMRMVGARMVRRTRTRKKRAARVWRSIQITTKFLVVTPRPTMMKGCVCAYNIICIYTYTSVYI